MAPSRLWEEDDNAVLNGLRRIRLAIASQAELEFYHTFSDLRSPKTCGVSAIGALIRQLPESRFQKAVDLMTARNTGDRRRLNNSVMLSCRWSLRDPGMSGLRHDLASHFGVCHTFIDQVESISTRLLYGKSRDQKLTPHQRVLAFLEEFDKLTSLFRKGGPTHVHC